MAINYNSTTNHSPPFQQDPSRTKYFHHPKRSTRHYFPHFRLGPLAIHYPHSLETPSKPCGYRPFVNIMPPFAITSPTRTLPASNNNFLKQFFTMRTNVPPHYEYIAPSCTTGALQLPLLTPWSSRSCRTARSSSSRTPSPTSKNNSANSTHGHWEPARTCRMLTSFQKGKNSSWLEDPLWASLQLHFDPCWIASPSWYTTSFQELSHTTWRQATFSTWSSASRIPTSMTCLHRRSTIRTWQASSRALTPIASSTAGASHSSFSLQLWAPIQTKLFQSKQTPPTTLGTWSKAEHVAPWTLPGKSTSVTSSASSWCPWRWRSSPSATPSSLKFEAPPWALLWARRYVWWLWHCQRKSGTKPIRPHWPTWTYHRDSCATWTIDYASLTHHGSTRSALPIFYTRSSTESRSFSRPNLTRNS